MVACRSLRALVARLGLVASLPFVASAALAQSHTDAAGTSIPAFVLMDGCVTNGACAGPNGSGNPLFVAPAPGANWYGANATTASPSPTIGAPAPLSVDAHGVLRAGLYDANGNAVDLTQPQPVIPYLSSSWTVSDVSCTSAGTALALADSAGAAKQRSFVNVSGTTIYIGPASGVTASTGFAIPSGAAPSNPAPGYTGPVYCYAAATQSLGVSQLQ